MTPTEVIVSLGAGVIAILIAVTSYFMQKWIQSVDETLKEHTNSFKNVSEQISTFKQNQNYQAENISKTIQSKISEIRVPYNEISEIKHDVKLIKHIIQEKLLPQAAVINDSVGRVVVLETQMQEQNKKLLTMFAALTLLDQKTKNPK